MYYTNANYKANQYNAGSSGYLGSSPEPTPTPGGARERAKQLEGFLATKTPRNAKRNARIESLPPAAGSEEKQGIWFWQKLSSYVRNGRYRALEEEIADGAPPDLADNEGNTLLIIAAQNGQKRIAKLLLRNGADMDAFNYRGNTALHFAKEYGFYDLFDYLIEKGADDTLLNDEGLHCYQGIGKEMRPNGIHKKVKPTVKRTNQRMMNY